MQKTGRSAQKENLSVFTMPNMTFLYFTPLPHYALIRTYGLAGLIMKDDVSRLNSLKTAGVFSYFAP